MSAVFDRPVPSRTYRALSEFLPDGNSTYFFGTSVEFRSQISTDWERNVSGLHLVEISETDISSIRVEIGGATHDVLLRSSRQLQRLWQASGATSAYIDITGLSHHVWAPLLRSGLAMGVSIKIVYIEPQAYRYHANPTQGEIFDLSDRILGVMPLPGFASLSTAAADTVFVPLLGFEGTRLAYLVENIEPVGGKIIPVVGVPGFRPEYPFFTYLGNRLVLSDTGAWKQVRYAKANCPFSLLYTLRDIAAAWPEHRLQIAPIGTKPHALGAVLYALAEPDNVELIYDHPIRKATRTQGTSRVSVYYLDSIALR